MAPKVIGVCGAGTMGAGIAQLACLAGAHTLLHDPVPDALGRGIESIESQLTRGVERDRWSEDDARAAGENLEAASTLDALAPCELVIEAAPESLRIKHELFEALSAIVAPECVLATNTSSLPVTAIAAAATHPERVVGMHFFNPAPVMRLLEVVAGDASDERAIEVAQAAGEAMGKRVIVAADGPGFLVNRCGRPFGLEALRLLQERIAPVEQIDRICRMGGGFRMGPFELMDLVGVDVGFEVSKSFYEQSFGEPRWRPSMITARLVAAGRHGRKAGRGYYDYGEQPHRPEDPEPMAVGGGEGTVVVAGEGVLAEQLRAAAETAGYAALAAVDAQGEPPFLIVDCEIVESAVEYPPLEGAPMAVLCADSSLSELEPEGAAVGFHALPPFDQSRLVELTRGETTSTAAAERTERFFATLGKHTEWVGDAPGLVLGRIVCQLINEAAFALGEGVGGAEDIDAGMLLGLNYPHGPLHWADAIGLDHVLAVLDGLAREYGEPRYRAAPLLRRHVAAGRYGHSMGAGFFQHDA
ncbi:MAG: 3-hydroxybutyryl-CoA dehydrogenase [Solirubrobacteraceae bacterium]|nr:3-hydroxybutyryl-CoA dehydrogenase [Solirubrobacteraceae bacterium]